MEYVWLPTPSGIAIPLALIKNQHAFAIYSDHLHTPRIVTNAQQEIVWRWDYSGFGEIAAQATTIKQTTNPTNQAPKSLQVNLRYPGQYFDVESGLHYNWHRSYDQHTGRYTQADPIGLNGGWNRFGYAGGNAVMRYDPNGKSWAWAGAGLVIGGYWAYKTWRGISEGLSDADKASEDFKSYRFYQEQTYSCIADTTCRPELCQHYLNMANFHKNRGISRTQNAAFSLATSVPGTSITGPVPTSRADIVGGAVQNVLIDTSK